MTNASEISYLKGNKIEFRLLDNHFWDPTTAYLHVEIDFNDIGTKILQLDSSAHSLI